jgi:gluconokinase
LSADHPIDTIILTGVTGSGKTTVGLALAHRLGWVFCDADDLHDEENIERIRRNEPLDDERRRPWLKRVRTVIETSQREGGTIVVACSALKEKYRRFLVEGLSGIRFVFLHGDPSLLRSRLERRRGHFAGPALLDSQLADLEPPTDALAVDIALPVSAIVDMIAADLGGAQKAERAERSNGGGAESSG